MKFYFLNTCFACPEQYEVYRDNGFKCCYIRLRWGSLFAEFPDIDGDIIYHYEFEDSFKGTFDNEEERNYYLREISNRLKDKIMGLSDDDIEVDFEIFTDIGDLEKRFKL